MSTALIQTAARHLPSRAIVRALSTGPTSPVRLLPHHRVHLLFGANTDVGKSVVSTGLVHAAASSKHHESVNYIKPLQCGGSDESFVLSHENNVKSTSGKLDGGEPDVNVNCQTLFNWETPASPHLASRWENLPVSDDEVLSSLQASLKDVMGDAESSVSDDDMSGITIIETAGGVLSPSSSSPQNSLTTASHWGWSTQADLYATLKVPVVFVGDGKLGGISVTLASLEALWSRGYQIDAVVFIESVNNEDHNENSDGDNNVQFGAGNTEALREYMATQPYNGNNNLQILDEDSIICLPALPPMPIPLDDWYTSNQAAFMKLHHLLCQRWRDK